jgi:mannose-6-phosphate isomerase-like protein (cupin superfamily)
LRRERVHHFDATEKEAEDYAMTDVTVKTFDELDDYAGQFLYAGKGLGVTAWGMNVERLPAGWDEFPHHDHAENGQEEVYVVIDGDATLHADGETWHLERGTLARVGPEQKRKIVPGEKGVTLLALGGTPGKAYEPRKS